MSEAGAVLRAVVGTYGGAALTDPVALRAALRRLGAGLPAAEVAALIAVAGVAGLRSGGGAGQGGAVLDEDEVVSAVRAGTDLPEADVRTACAAFVEVLRPGAAPAPRLTWDEVASRPTPGGPPVRRRRGRWVALGAVLVALAGVLVVVVATTGGGAAGAPAPPDPHALDQVAQRFRALGADLVGGALRCAPLSPDPGETERVSCDFGGSTMVLVGYDSTGRLRAHRESALAAAPQAPRSAVATGDGAAFAMAEEAGGRSTVYWDVESPRPVSATVTGSRPLAELLAFHDARRFAALRRPELPGPAFADPALWELAAVVVVGGRGECRPTPREQYFPGVVEQVGCTFPNGVLGDFGRFTDGRAVTAYRASAAGVDDTVPGTVRTGSWSDVDDTPDAQTQLIEYVLAADGDSYLYYDRRETLGFGLLYHPDLSQDQLREFFLFRGLEQ